MSQADVDAINAHTDAKLAALPAAVARAVHSQQLFGAKKPDGTPLTFGDVLFGEYGEHPITTAQAQQLVAAGLTEQVGPMTQAIVDGLKAALPSEVAVDYDRVGQVVASKLDEHLGTLRIVSDAPPAG
jgi:hypothetical protein